MKIEKPLVYLLAAVFLWMTFVGFLVNWLSLAERSC